MLHMYARRSTLACRTHVRSKRAIERYATIITIAVEIYASRAHSVDFFSVTGRIEYTATGRIRVAGFRESSSEILGGSW